MNILFITTTFPTPARPRQGAFNQVLVSALSTRHDVRVIAPVPWSQSLGRGGQVSAGGRVLHPTYYYPPKILRGHHHRFYWNSIGRSLERLESSFRPDLVLGYFLHPDGAAAVMAAERFGVPAIVMAGGTDLRLMPNQRGRRAAVEQVLERTNRLVVVSHELAEHAYRLGMEASKVDVVYRGIDRGCFRPMDPSKARVVCDLPTSDVVLVWAGRLEEVKNPGMLVRAAAHWKKVWGDRLRVIVAGSGSLQRPLEQLCQILDLKDNIEFAGDLSQEDLALRFNAADATVLTSDSEGVPNVLLESIACGTPFVATDVGGVSEIATTGIDRLTPVGDTDAFADAVIQQIHVGPVDCRRRFVPNSTVGMAAEMEAVFRKELPESSPAAPAPLGSALYGAPRTQPALYESGQS